MRIALTDEAIAWPRGGEQAMNVFANDGGFFSAAATLQVKNCAKTVWNPRSLLAVRLYRRAL